jgi:4-methylaminobutanoate oxidase (formaldehyde-forming)
VEKARADRPRRRLVSFVAGDPDAMLWGGELLVRDGRPAGQVTSAAWGSTVGAAAGLAWAWDPDGGPVSAEWLGAGSYEIEAGSVRCTAAISLKAPYDPSNSRIRS